MGSFRRIIRSRSSGNENCTARRQWASFGVLPGHHRVMVNSRRAFALKTDGFWTYFMHEDLKMTTRIRAKNDLCTIQQGCQEQYLSIFHGSTELTGLEAESPYRTVTGYRLLRFGSTSIQLPMSNSLRCHDASGREAITTCAA